MGRHLRWSVTAAQRDYGNISMNSIPWKRYRSDSGASAPRAPAAPASAELSGPSMARLLRGPASRPLDICAPATLSLSSSFRQLPHQVPGHLPCLLHRAPQHTVGRAHHSSTETIRLFPDPGQTQRAPWAKGQWPSHPIDSSGLRTRQILVRRLDDGTELRGRIVETEAYLGPEDEAAHSRGGRQTPRNRGMFMKPGTLYVYLIYGMYFCMNVSSQGDGACVLLRALEPLGGLEAMRQLRHTFRKGAAGRALKDRELCNGLSKLCQALAIDRSFDQRDLAGDESVWLEQGPPEPSEPAVVAAARVGIGQAGEWAQKPLRFYMQGSPWVSVVDRAAERDTQAGARACSHEDF
ncbi:DNA-3-methyladenine glycosylase-like [Moschus berezovskii]|uniref:DNA-3-methyladenine glycosylase-like n=1 Tax=Moschus berezovskii TaxID=68408 RepID=UPI002444D202|nr:DNA-3-methyladenine glycosylase-like [Moschus berezovskii]